MAQIIANPPRVYMPGGTTGQVNMDSAPIVGTINDGDFLVRSGNGVAAAGANVAGGIVGIAEHASNKTFGGSINAQPAPTFAFGFTQEGDPGFAANDSLEKYARVDSPAGVEINLLAGVGWISGGTSQANLGTLVGLAIDGATGFYVADPTAVNKIGSISGKIVGPSAGDVGDTGGRVQIAILATAIAP